VNDVFAPLIISSPMWLVHCLGVAFVCKSAVPALRQSQRPGWRPALIAWAAVAGVLYGPWVVLGAHPNFPLSAVAVLLSLAALTVLPFAGTAISLNYRVPPKRINSRIGFAALVGLLGIIVALYLKWKLLSAVGGLEMYP
jgi:hypothetical protein